MSANKAPVTEHGVPSNKGGWKPKTEEVKEESKAEYVLNVNYCGSWGYKKHCETLQTMIERHWRFKGKISYNFMKDWGKTGRFLVTVAKG